MSLACCSAEWASEEPASSDSKGAGRARSASLTHQGARCGAQWCAQHTKKYQSEAFFKFLPLEWWTNIRAIGSFFLVAQSVYSPQAVGNGDRMAPKRPAVPPLVQGTLPTALPAAVPKKPITIIFALFPKGTRQCGRLFDSCHTSSQRWWSWGITKYWSVLFSLKQKWFKQHLFRVGGHLQ